MTCHNRGVGEATDATPPVVRGSEFRGARAAKNSLYLLGSQLFVLIIALATTPIILSKLGLAQFGIFVFAISTVNLLTVIDPGFGDIVTRYGAQARVRGESRIAARICTLGSLAWLAFGALLTPLVVLATPFFIHHIKNIHPGAASAAVPFMYWTFGLLIFGSLQSTLSGRLVAIGDQWVATTIDAASRGLYAVVLIVLLTDGWRLSAIVLATSLQYVVVYVVTFFTIWWRDDFPYGNPRGLDRTLLRQLSRFGGLLQLNSILDTLTFDTDFLFIGVFVSNAAIGLWGIAQRLGRLTMFFASSLQSNVLPGISAAFAADEGMRGLRRIYVRANRFIALVGMFLAGSFIAYGPLLLKSWLGRPYFAASTATILVVASMAAGLPRQVTGNAILAMGRVGLGLRAQILAFLVNLALTLALVWPYGLNGVLFGTVVAKVVATSYLLIRFVRIVESTVRELIWPWMLPIVVVTTISSLLGRFLMNLWPSAFHSRLCALGALAVLGAAYSVIFALGLRLTKYFTLEELTWLKSAAPALLGRLLTPRVIRLFSGNST